MTLEGSKFFRGGPNFAVKDVRDVSPLFLGFCYSIEGRGIYMCTYVQMLTEVQVVL